MAEPSPYLKDTLSSVRIFNQELRDIVEARDRTEKSVGGGGKTRGKGKKAISSFRLGGWRKKKEKKKKIERIDNFLT